MTTPPMPMLLPPMEMCRQCSTQLAPDMTACPRCGRLVHSDRLAELATTAREATDRNDLSLALSIWREALILLPEGSRQHDIISRKIIDLGEATRSNSTVSAASGEPKSLGSKIAGTLGAIGLAVWKLKALFLGLTKGSTFFSMLLSLGVYWTMWGWKFALGLVLSIYVHEMGHVIALRRYGFKATAPMFIPGLGALIRLQQQIVSPDEDAEIGLAGPIYGLGAAVFCAGIWFLTRQPFFAAIAGVGAWINLFNLMPVSTLDGGRGFHAMSQMQKFLAAATVAGAWYFTGDGLLVIIALIGAVRAIADKSRPKGSWRAAGTYIGLVIALASVSMARGHRIN